MISGLRLPHLGTGAKMLVILTIALLPLGLIALFASLESAQANQLRRESEARGTAAAGARQLSTQIARLSLVLREATDSLAASGDEVSLAQCQAALDDVALAQHFTVQFAVYRDAKHRLCATPGFSAAPLQPPTMVFATEVRLAPEANVLRFEARDPDVALFAVGELPRASLADIARPASFSASRSLTLRAGDIRLPLVIAPSRPPLGRAMSVSSPVAGGQVLLEVHVGDFAISPIEIVMALLPLLMWIAAALIGWLVVDRLLIRPLEQIQSAIAGYRPGQTVIMPKLTTPAQELRSLGHAFEEVTETIAAHERELEAGLARQTKLTREVHHRVKNNLQVVASLINLHARGVGNPEVSAAYASIQRRVDALAVVHRNHFAEIEENRGLGLRGLIGELASNLRASAPPQAAGLAITLDLIQASAHQDVAVPVAFLLTELIELAMTNDPGGRIAIRLANGEDPKHAELSVTAAGLTDPAMGNCPARERAERVILGLSRQLRAPLRRDATAGSYEIAIAILPDRAEPERGEPELATN